MKVVVDYTPGRWGAPATWTAKFKIGSKEHTIEDIPLTKLYDTLIERLAEDHGKRLTKDDLQCQYLVYDQDFTTEIEEANQLRKDYEETNRAFKTNRIKLVRAMRDAAPPKGYPVVWEAMAEVLGYQVSTVVAFSKENPDKYAG